MRTVPDVVFDADTNTGVQIYDSYDQANPLFQEGGTSLAAPCWAGLIAIADQGRVAAGGTTLAGPGQTLPALYSLPGGDYNEITNSAGNTATSAYNSISGLGSPKANLLVGDLADYQMPHQPGLISNQTPAKLHLVIFSQPPGTLTAGNGFGLAVSVEDQFGNVDSTFTGGMTLVLAQNPGDGSLSGQLTSMVSQGVASFSGLVIDQAGTNYVLQINCQGLTTTANPLNIIAGNATKLVVVSEPPTTVQPGSKFGISVWAEDSFGNLVTSYSGNLAVVLTGPHGKSRPSGTPSQHASNGQVSFSNLSVKMLGNGYTLNVSGNGLPTVTTTRFNVSLPPKKPAASLRVAAFRGDQQSTN